jgi:hypothetical protein
VQLVSGNSPRREIPIWADFCAHFGYGTKALSKKMAVEALLAAIKRMVKKLSSWRDGQNSPAKDARIDRISARSEQRQYRTVHDGSRQAKAALAMVYQEYGNLDQAAYNRAVGREQAET